MVDFNKLLKQHELLEQLISMDDLVAQGDLIDSLSEQDTKALLRMAVRKIETRPKKE